MTGAETPARLEIERLKVVSSNTGADIVDDIGLRVVPGEVLGLVGESGSGKSTVALAALGFARRGLAITGGRVLLDGADMLRMSEAELRSVRGKRITYVAQDAATALNPARKIGTQLHELAVVHGVAKGEATACVEHALESVRLVPAALLERYPHQLSGGQQQRVALAMGFALRPSVVVLDEPTSGLDVTTQRHLLETIRSLCATYGVAAIFVSHHLGAVADLVDTVAVMYAGRIMERGRKEEVFGDARHPYTQALLNAVPSLATLTLPSGLPGAPPRPGNRPDGCFFAPRCEFAAQRCRTDTPADEFVGGNHAVRCLRVSEGLRVKSALRPAFGDAPGLSTAPVILDVNILQAHHGRVPVLWDIRFQVGPHECLAIVGESGSGKTTLARCIVGLHASWRGEIELHGRPLSNTSRRRTTSDLRSIQYIFQNPYASLNPRHCVYDILEQPLKRFFTLSSGERRGRIHAALHDAALSGTIANAYPGDLSGGERQRVAIARALVAEPDVLVCDEITSALDVSVQASVLDTLQQLHQDRAVALIFISHDIALLGSFARQVAVLNEGRIVEFGSCEAVLRRPSAEYTAQLLRDGAPSSLLRMDG